jgi:hypothetical protein
MKNCSISPVNPFTSAEIDLKLLEVSPAIIVGLSAYAANKLERDVAGALTSSREYRKAWI